MSPAEIIEIINIIPRYIIYIYPGYITIYSYYFFRGKTLHDNKQVMFKSVILSYIYITLTAFVPVTNAFFANVGYIILSIVIAYFAYRATTAKLIYDIFDFFKINTTFYESEVEALAGCENGAWLI